MVEGEHRRVAKQVTEVFRREYSADFTYRCPCCNALIQGGRILRHVAAQHGRNKAVQQYLSKSVKEKIDKSRGPQKPRAAENRSKAKIQLKKRTAEKKAIDENRKGVPVLPPDTVRGAAGRGIYVTKKRRK